MITHCIRRDTNRLLFAKSAKPILTTEGVLESLLVSNDQRAEYSKMNQGTKKWLSARKGRITASVFGAIAGNNPFSTPDQLLHQLIYEKFEGNAATRYGTAMEPRAVEYYRGFRSGQLSVPISLDVPGLVIHPEHVWLAGSPDGVITEINNNEKGLLEIKCPFRRKVYPKMPPYYFDQIQGLMEILDLHWCDFCVWTPDRVEIKRIDRQPKYWNDHLFPKLESFFFDKYLPEYLKAEKLKLEGNTETPKKEPEPEFVETPK